MILLLISGNFIRLRKLTACLKPFKTLYLQPVTELRVTGYELQVDG